MNESARFWMVRHALVEENARAMLYGTMDVELCPHTLLAQGPMYAALAQRLPAGARWLVTPLSRTRRTAAAIFGAGYPVVPLGVEQDLIEQHLGDWQGLPHADLPARLDLKPHPFWPVAADEIPPGGESFAQVVTRVGRVLERLAAAHAGQDVVIVSHGGAIRAAIAHALDIAADRALHFSIFNLSLSQLERSADGWRVVSVNEMPGY